MDQAFLGRFRQSSSIEQASPRLCNRLLYRSRQRGFLELDLVLGKWVEQNVYSLGADGVTSLISVLDLENPDLWKWLSGQEQPPEAVNVNPVFSAIHEKVMNQPKHLLLTRDTGYPRAAVGEGMGRYQEGPRWPYCRQSVVLIENVQQK